MAYYIDMVVFVIAAGRVDEAYCSTRVALNFVSSPGDIIQYNESRWPYLFQDSYSFPARQIEYEYLTKLEIW